MNNARLVLPKTMAYAFYKAIITGSYGVEPEKVFIDRNSQGDPTGFIGFELSFEYIGSLVFIGWAAGSISTQNIAFDVIEHSF